MVGGDLSGWAAIGDPEFCGLGCAVALRLARWGFEADRDNQTTGHAGVAAGFGGF